MDFLKGKSRILMLVLLLVISNGLLALNPVDYIFKIVNPLHTNAVKVELPKASVTRQGAGITIKVRINNSNARICLSNRRECHQVNTDKQLARHYKKVIRKYPDAVTTVEGSRNPGYARIVKVMSVLQAAGAKSIGLVTR